MHIDILTLFPDMFDGPLTESILKRAQERDLISIQRHNIRDYTTDKHHSVDDTPYGGGRRHGDDARPAGRSGGSGARRR